jgi:hypothetical protein
MKSPTHCIYRKNIMKYGLREQVLCKTILINGKYVNKKVYYKLNCWSCPMEEDDSDIVLDKNDEVSNNAIIEEANRKLNNET